MINRTDACAATWRTSTYSGGGNQCVEAGVLPGGEIAVRDTKDREAGAHRFSAPAWTAFLSEIKAGTR